MRTSMGHGIGHRNQSSSIRRTPESCNAPHANSPPLFPHRTVSASSTSAQEGSLGDFGGLASAAAKPPSASVQRGMERPCGSALSGLASWDEPWPRTSCALVSSWW